MPIIKDDRLALRKYYPIADIVIIASFLWANAFVVMQIFDVGFLASWAAKVETNNITATKFLKHYPGFYFIFQHFCHPVFWVINNLPHIVASWFADVLEGFRYNYYEIANAFGISALHRFVAKFANSHPNLVLQFYDNKLYVYSVGEAIICISAILYGLIVRLITKILYALVGR